jgi:predicted nucleic acid-binding Zn finger protein
MKVNLLGKQKNEYTVTIGVKLSCSCEFFTWSSASRKKVSCKHIVWVMLSILGVSEESDLLHQVALTESEVKKILKDVPEKKKGQSFSTSQPSPTIVLTAIEMDSIFESKRSCEPQQVWHVAKKNERLRASCCSCKSAMLAGKLFVCVKGLYIPRGQRFATPRQFYFCADLHCLSQKPFASNLVVPPTVISVGPNSELSPADVALIESRGLPIKF